MTNTENKLSKSQSSFGKSLKPYHDNIRTNGKSGSKCLYYQGDYTHQEIEMYNHLGYPIDALNPINGERLFKDVSRHRPLDL